MKLTRIEIFRTNLPLKHPARISPGVVEVTDAVYVRVHCENGRYGMGEANSLTPVVAETMRSVAPNDLCARLLVGADIDGIHLDGLEQCEVVG